MMYRDQTQQQHTDLNLQDVETDCSGFRHQSCILNFAKFQIC